MKFVFLMLIMNMVLTIYECNSFWWEWVIKREAITSYLSLYGNWFERHHVNWLCNSSSSNDGNMGRGLDDQNLREIRGVRNWGNDRMNYLKKFLVQRGSFSWMGSNVYYFCII